jgi:WS/DGAT/MGAT family acyltransferase
MLSAAFRNTVAQYTRIVKAVPDALRMAGAAGAGLLSSSQAKTAGAPSEQGTGFGHLADLKPGESLQKVAHSLLKRIPGGIALGPRTSLNVAISGERAFAGIALPLAETKAIASHFDAKLNDIVLAVCAGALRRYFAGNTAALAKAMIAGVPASLRVPGDTSQSNQVTMMLVNMATNIADPRKRLAAIIKASTKAKTLTGSMKNLIPMDLPSLGIPWLMSVITPLYRTAVATNRIPVVANLVVSNVPGPQMPLYLAGAELKTYYPVSIVTHGLALNITIQSYAGSLYYGLIACKQSVPDLREFAKHMQAAHEELRALSRQRHPPAPGTARKATARAAGATTVAALAKTGKSAVAKPVIKKTAKLMTAKQTTATRKTAMTKPATAKPAMVKRTITKSKAKKKHG